MFLRLSWSLFNPFPGGGRASQWIVRYLHLRSCCLGFKPRGSRNFTSTGMGKRRNWLQRSRQVWKYPEEDSRIYKCVERSHWGTHGFVLRGKRGHCPQDFMLEFSFYERTLEMEAVVAKNEGSVCGVKWTPVMLIETKKKWSHWLGKPFSCIEYSRIIYLKGIVCFTWYINPKFYCNLWEMHREWNQKQKHKSDDPIHHAILSLVLNTTE